MHDLLLFVHVDCLGCIACDNLFHHTRKFGKRRRIRRIVFLHLEIDLCVKVLLHCVKRFEATLVLRAIDENKEKIHQSDNREADKLRRAYADLIESAVSPKRKNRKQHERHAKIDARAVVLVLFDRLIVHVLVAYDIAGVTEAHAKVLHPTVTQRLRCF